MNNDIGSEVHDSKGWFFYQQGCESVLLNRPMLSRGYWWSLKQSSAPP